MKVQIIGLKYSIVNAVVEVKTPEGSVFCVTLPTNKVLTKKELASSIQDVLSRLDEMGRRMRIVKDLYGQEIEIK